MTTVREMLQRNFSYSANVVESPAAQRIHEHKVSSTPIRVTTLWGVMNPLVSTDVTARICTHVRIPEETR